MSQQSLATLRNLTWTYLGTYSGDPLYTPTVVNGLLNNVVAKFVTDIQESRPDYLQSVVTLTAQTSTSNAYNLPSDFSGFLEVRLNDYTGTQLTYVRMEELNQPTLIYSFSITGADQNAVLYTCPTMTPGVPLYFRYQYVPPDLVNDSDVPTWMPSRFHDLIARQAAIDAYGIGNEDVPADLFVTETQDRIAQFYLEVARRGATPVLTRNLTP